MDDEEIVGTCLVFFFNYKLIVSLYTYWLGWSMSFFLSVVGALVFVVVHLLVILILVLLFAADNDFNVPKNLVEAEAKDRNDETNGNGNRAHYTHASKENSYLELGALDIQSKGTAAALVGFAATPATTATKELLGHGHHKKRENEKYQKPEPGIQVKIDDRTIGSVGGGGGGGNGGSADGFGP